MKNYSTKQFLTVEQISELLQVHWQTVLRLIRSGDLPAFKLGRGYRITKKDFDEFIIKKKSEGINEKSRSLR